MPRIDLFVTLDCPSSPRARAVVNAFVASNPHVVLQEWDLARDPGPAVGRGIVATPAVLLDDERILLGVPTLNDLAAHFGVLAPEIVLPAAAADPIAAMLRAPRLRPRRLPSLVRGPAIAAGLFAVLFGLISYGDGPNLRMPGHVGEQAPALEKTVRCECGHVTGAKDDDELVARVQEHARSVHQKEITREQVLAMAVPG